MLFSTNQKFQVSGENDKRYLSAVIDFAVRLSGCREMFTRTDRPLTVTYLTTKSGLYLIGTGRTAGSDRAYVPDGWNELPFDYDPDILAGIVSQWLDKQPRPYSEFEGCDGSVHKGFLCQSVSELDPDETRNIPNVHTGVVCFRPFTCFYSK